VAVAVAVLGVTLHVLLSIEFQDGFNEFQRRFFQSDFDS